MELCSSVKREGKRKTKDSNRGVRSQSFVLLSSIPDATENHFVHRDGSLIQTNFGTISTCLQITTNSEKENPHILAFLTPEQTSNMGKQGELFIVPFTSAADES